MSKYIDADELKRSYAPLEGCLDVRTLDGAKKIFDAFVDGMPAADVVEVVRCRECKYRKDEQPGMVYCPHMIGGLVNENWFCAGGEKE